jgi:invasion protein IalB
MNRWMAIFLVCALVVAGAGGFFLYDRLVSPEASGPGVVQTESPIASPQPNALKPVQSPPTTAITGGPSVGPGWAMNCKSQTTESPLECRMSQTVVTKPNGRVVASVTFRVPTDTKRPEILIQLPLGLYIPAGASYQVDGGAAQRLNFRACDRTGCYAQTTLTPEMLASLRSGTKLILGFQTLAQKPINLSLSLGGFGETFDKIQGRS